MSEWREVSLGEILSVHHGFAFKGAFFAENGQDVLLTPKNFRREGGLDLSAGRCRRYSGPVDNDFVLSSGDLVMALTDLKQEAPILGAVGRITGSERVLHNQRIGKIVIDAPTQLVPDFARWMLNGPSVRASIRASATGTTVRHTAPRRVAAIRVGLPPIATQRRIAAVLSAFDDLIEINERRIELLENVARSLYDEWFVRFRLPAYESGAPSTSGDDSSPHDWESSPLSRVAAQSKRSVKPGAEPRTVFTHFSIPAFDAGALPVVESGSCIKSTKYVVPSDAVLLSKLNPRIPRVWWVKPPEAHAIASTEFLVWQGVSVSNAWLWCLFQSDPFKRWMIGVAGGTSTSHQRVQPSDVEQYEAAVPPNGLLARFDADVTPALDLADDLRHHNRALATTRDLLLPRLVTGRLDIDDIDLGDLLSEPAPAT